MANFDFKTATPDTSLTGTELWFGADSQSSATPSIYTLGGLKTYLLGGGSLAITAAKTLTATNSLTLAGTDGTTMTFPTSSATLAGLGIANLFTTAQTISPVTDVTALTARGGPSGTTNVFQLQDSSNNLLAAFDKDGKLTLGRGSALTGQIKFSNATNNNLITLQAGTSSGNVTYTLPTADGTNGQVLQTNGSGALSWKTDATTSPAGSDTQVQFNNSGSFGADSTLTFNTTTKHLGAQRFGLSGNFSAAAWTTNGIRYVNTAATITDTTSSGTVAAAYTNVYGGNTIAATNSTTFTDYYNTFIAAPVQGTNVTFTNSWALGLSGGLNIAQGTANTNVVKATGYSLTGSNASSMIDLAGTWNTTGTPTAIKLNVTDTASNAASLLMDLQVGGSTKFNVDKNGTIVSSRSIPNVIIAPSVGSTSGLGINVNGLYAIAAGNYSLALQWISSGTIIFANLGSLNWSSTSSAVGTTDLSLTRRGAANLRLGAADAAAPVAQTLSVQSVVAGTSNTAGTNFTITGSQGTGSGAGGSIIFQTAAAGSSGTAQNALATALTIDSTKAATFTGDLTGNTLNTYYLGTNVPPGGASACGFGSIATGLLGARIGTSWSFSSGSDRLALNKDSYFGFSSLAGTDNAFSNSGNIDTRLYRDTAATLAQRNTTNAQTYRIYNTYTSDTNYERGKLEWSGSVFNIGTEKGSGGGTARSLAFQTDGTTRLILDTNGMLDFGGSTSSFPALKRSSTTLQVRLADDSAFAPLSSGNFASDGSILSSSATGGTGYATGAGGAVTQATDRTTGVTLDKICGQITLVSAAGTATWQTFTVTNSTVAATDTVRVVQASGTDLYQIFITNVSAGSFKITFATTGGTTTEQPVFNFSVIKAVAA